MTSNGGVSRRRILSGVGSAGALALAGCQSTGGGNPTGTGEGSDGQTLTGSVDIKGSSTVFPLAMEIRQRFLDEHGEASVNVSPTGTGGGFQNSFCTGNTDLNNASRPITDTEQQLCADNGVTPVRFKVATDAITVVVNDDADWVDCMTVEELAEIWSAESKPTTWSDVNSDWPDEELKLFGPSGASGTYDYFHEAVVGEENEIRTDYQGTEKDQQIMRGVKNDEYALGYLGYAYYADSKDRVKALGIDNGNGCVKPSLETAKNGEYKPLSRPLFTYAAKASLAEPTVAAFVRFWLEHTTSEAIVADAVGYVPNTKSTKEEMLSRLETKVAEASG